MRRRHHVDEADGVDIENGGGVGIVAQLGRVAGEAEDVVQPDGRRAEQVRLDAENVAVAAGVMQHRLDAGVLLDLDAEALRAHARRGARRVGHVDGVHAELRQKARAFDLLEQSMPRGGTISTRVTNVPVGDESADARTLARAARAAFRC